MLTMIANVIAALGLLVCVVLAVDMALPVRRQRAVRAWLRGLRFTGVKRLGQWRNPFNSRERRRAAHDAALDAIERAKGRSSSWDGNVYRGDEFKQRRKPH